MAVNLETMESILSAYTFTANLFEEEDGSITASLKDFDIVVNGKDQEEAFNQLADDLIDYAEEYYEHFDLYSKSPNRKTHLPFVLHVLLKGNLNKVKELISCPAAKN